MAGPTSWETVSYKKNPTANDKKAARKAFFEKATIVEEFKPLEDTDTIYSSAFRGPKPNVTAKKNKEVVPQQKGNPSKKKKNDKQKLVQFTSLEDALREVSLSDVERQWNDVKTRCKEAPSLWLGDIVDYLTRKLEVKSPPTFVGESVDFPCCKLSPKLHDFLSSTLTSYGTKMLKEFFDYCLAELLAGLSKGQPVYAYLIFIQLLVQKHPVFVTNSYKQFLELVKKKQNERLPCLALLWICNQAGRNDSITALKVWNYLMLPMMSNKIISPYAVSTLERIMSGKLDKKKASEVFGPTQLFPLLDVIFTSNAALPPNLQKPLQKMYPRLRSIAYGPDPKTSLRKFFPSYLARTTRDCPENCKAELLNGLLHCLATDPHCFSEWRQMYDTHRVESGILLKHMVEKWSTVDSMLSRSLLHPTIHAFNLTNEESASKRGGKKNSETCRQSCKFLLEQMEKKTFPWKTVAFAAIFAVLICFISDFVLSKGLLNSRTHLFLQKTGLLNILKQAWNKIALYGGIAISWLAENVPLYYAKACELCGPYLSLLAQKFSWLCVKGLELLEPVIVWLQVNIAIALEWIQAKVPIVLDAIEFYLILTWTFLSTKSLAAYVIISPYLTETWETVSFYGEIVWHSFQPAFSSVWLWLKTSVGTT